MMPATKAESAAIIGRDSPPVRRTPRRPSPPPGQRRNPAAETARRHGLEVGRGAREGFARTPASVGREMRAFRWRIELTGKRLATGQMASADQQLDRRIRREGTADARSEIALATKHERLHRLAPSSALSSKRRHARGLTPRRPYECGALEVLVLVGAGRVGFTQDRTHTTGHNPTFSTGSYGTARRFRAHCP
jgi:hypothetical protein